ncbi:GtrA family protein [Subtercola sp. YIM 133946]|uniref:GtrA family protein n=1 Tax=Subtercola sp. YIM 133946 TaxID=3118909 RepID=UPI002F94E081
MTARETVADEVPAGGRFGPLARQFLKYFGVAAIGLVVDFGLLVLLTSGFGLNPVLGATVGFIGGLTVTYFLSERYVFSSPKITHAGLRFLIFAAIGLVGLGLVDGIVWLLTEQLGVFYVFSKIVATAVVYVWNFFARRTMYHS